jgi:hypothetical protein
MEVFLMETTAALVLPAQCSLLAADELTYLDGGAMHGLWNDWSPATFINSFAVMLGGATWTACTNYLIEKHKATGSISASFNAAFAAVGRRSTGQKVMLAMCGAAALYAFAYQTVVIYSTVSSIYYSIFPREGSEESEDSGDEIDISTLSPIMITI